MLTDSVVRLATTANALEGMGYVMSQHARVTKSADDLCTRIIVFSDEIPTCIGAMYEDFHHASHMSPR